MEAASPGRHTLDPSRPLFVAGLLILCGSLGLVAGVEPVLAIGGALAVVFALFALVDLGAGVALFVPFAFLYPGVLGKPLLAALLVLGLSWLANTARERGPADAETIRDRRRMAGLLAALLAWVMVSVSWAAESNEALLDVARFLLSALLFVIVLAAVRDRRDATLILGAYLIGAGAAAAYALVAPPDPGTGRLRGAGAGDPNELAAVLLPAIAIAGAAVVALRGSPALRLAAAGLGIVCFVAFLGTASRGGLIGLGVMLVAAIVFGGRWRGGLVLVTACAVALVSVYFAAFASTEIRERITEPGRGEVQVEESRVTLWDAGWRIVQDKPVLGVGVGNFASAAVPYLFQPGEAFRSEVILDEKQPTHNTYLHLFAELGVLGGLLFVALVGACLWSCLNAARRFAEVGDRVMEALSRGVLIGQIGMAAAIFFFSAQTVNEVWLMLALGPALLAVARSEEQVAGRPWARTRA